MDGITVVAEHPCSVIGLGELIGYGILVTLLVFGGLCLYIYNIYMYKNETNKLIKNVTSICAISLVIIYITFWVVQINQYNDTYMEYTVTVDDSVSFNDFHAKYEIVSVNGNEYRVVEK